MILYSIFLGFIGSRIGVMAFDFMCYKEVFWFVKEYVLIKIIGTDYYDFIHENLLSTKSETAILIQEKCDQASNRFGFWPFVLCLLDCKFCLTVWASLIVGLFGVIMYNLGFESILIVVIVGYIITEKI